VHALGLQTSKSSALWSLSSRLSLARTWQGKDLAAAGQWTEGRDVWVDDLAAAQRPVCPPAWQDAEDLLFILFTSGSTGKPKGVAHSTAGYLLFAAMTCQVQNKRLSRNETDGDTFDTKTRRHARLLPLR
jgi:acyl-coenzyme A synthetase/AMP-(fatty) acid ligase